jgi:hypothetical protein
MQIYINSTLRFSSNIPSGNAVSTDFDLYIGHQYRQLPFNGTIDEVRISNICRNNSWINTSYNTMNNPEKFLSVGTEEINQDDILPTVEISTPHWGCIYFTLSGTPYVYIPFIPIITLIIGKITVAVNASDNIGIESVKFYIDEELRATVTEPEPPPYDWVYTWFWDEQTSIAPYTLKVVARDFSGNEANDIIKVWKIQLFP